MRKILYISGTRADYGLMKQTLLAIKKNPNLRLKIIATGMHLMPEFGRTINEIKKDGFRVHKINAIFEKDTKESMANFIGKLIQLLTKKIKKIKPDIILVQGDRVEMLAGAIVGAYLGIPVAHSHGGDVSSTVDESVRHAITKLANIHFPATRKSGERIEKMGEDVWRIFVVGAPRLDSVFKEKLLSKKEVVEKYNLDLSRPVLLVLQHPVSLEVKEAGKQMKETMEAIKELSFQAIISYPGADSGGRKIINVIEKYRKYPFVKIYKNIPHKDYLSLMKVVDVIVGNSSSGIIEAPFFRLAAVNIGTRQEGREKTKNVLDVDYKKNQIKRAIQKALSDRKFRQRVKKCKNPYGSGIAAKKITYILAKIKIDKRLLQKQINY